MKAVDFTDAVEVSRCGEEIYRQIRDVIETGVNLGKQIVIDVVSGDYEINHDTTDTGLEISRRLRERQPDAILYGMRIGYDAVYALGGTLTRT